MTKNIILQENLQTFFDAFDCLLTEALSNIERIKRARTMRRKSPILKRKRDIAMRQPLTQNKIKRRSTIRAKNAMIRNLSHGKSKSEMTFAERQRTERILKKRKGAIERLSRKIAIQMRKE